MRALRALAGATTRSTSLENPSTPLSPGRLMSELSDPSEVWSGSDSGGDKGPLGVAAALRCTQIIAASVAGCPIQVRERESGEKVVIPALTIEREGTTPFERWETTVAHMALWGNAYVRKVRNRFGQLLDLIPIHPSRVQVRIEDGGDVGLAYVKRFEIDGGRVNLTEHDIMHVPALSIDGAVGYSVVGNLRRTFGLATNAEKMADRMYANGMMLSGFLSTEKDLDQEKATILQERWRAKISGIDNAFNVPVLDKGTKFEQLTMNPADAQFLETRKFQTTEIARLFGVPGWIINDQEKSTSWGSGMEQQFISFVVITLKPYMHRIEQRITREICDPTFEKAEFKVEGLLRGDSKSRAAFYASGVQHGWLVPNDIRPLEGMKDVPWGDEPYRPYNESAASQANDETSTGGDDDDDADA